MDNIYKKLQERLDLYSFGYPPSETGDDISILKKLFTEEDAQIFLLLSQKLESPEEVIARTGIDAPGFAGKLESMASRGLLFRLNRNGIKRYGAIPFMHGLVEFRINNLDKELSDYLDNYFNAIYNKNIADSADLFLRVVPVNKAVQVKHHVAAFDEASQILKNADIIAITDCFCRKKAQTTGTACDRPLETCFMFGSMAEYYIENKIGRRIDFDEAVSILRAAQESGLVTQPATSQNPSGMCNCCGDCCAVLGAVKKFPAPAELVFSNYYVTVDESACIGCNDCGEVCPMEAISAIETGIAEVDLKRCIGCGLCSAKCPVSAITLVEKSEDKKRTIPASTREQMTLMAKKRGLA